MKNVKFFALIFFALLFWSGPGSAQEPPSLEQGNRLYEAREYGEAAKVYESLLADGYYSSALFYNLGNAYFRQKDWGRARWNYERAALLHPLSRDLRHNLNLLRDEAGLPPELPTFFLLRWWSAFNSWVGNGPGALGALLLVWLGAVLLVLAIRSPGRFIRQQPALRWTAGSLLLLGLLLAFSAWTYEQKISRPTYLVVLEEAPLHRSPDAETPLKTKLEAGSRLLWLESWKAWEKVQLLSGEKGWIAQEKTGPLCLKCSPGLVEKGKKGAEK
mgnify:FL=1